MVHLNFMKRKKIERDKILSIKKLFSIINLRRKKNG